MLKLHVFHLGDSVKRDPPPSWKFFDLNAAAEFSPPLTGGILVIVLFSKLCLSCFCRRFPNPRLIVMSVLVSRRGRQRGWGCLTSGGRRRPLVIAVRLDCTCLLWQPGSTYCGSDAAPCQAQTWRLSWTQTRQRIQARPRPLSKLISKWQLCVSL